VVARLVGKFPAFCGAEVFVGVFTRVLRFQGRVQYFVTSWLLRWRVVSPSSNHQNGGQHLVSCPRPPVQHIRTHSKNAELSWDTGWMIRAVHFDSWQGLGIFLFATVSRPALGPTQPPI